MVGGLRQELKQPKFYAQKRTSFSLNGGWSPTGIPAKISSPKVDPKKADASNPEKPRWELDSAQLEGMALGTHLLLLRERDRIPQSL